MDVRDPLVPCDRKPERVNWAALGRTLAATTCVAVLYPIMSISRSGYLGVSRMLKDFFAAAIFGACIGSLANFIPWHGLESRLRKGPVRWLAQTGILVVLAAVGTAICGVIFMLVGWVGPGVEPYGQFYLENLPIATLMTLLVGTALTIYETMRARLANATLDLRTKELERERALKLATEARLSSLESRLHPHFLFNTLNSISSLIPEDPERAEKLVGQMAALLRFSLDSTRNGVVPLERELKIVNDYLEIEKARLGERLKYDVTVPRDLDSLTVPPLAIQTLVENSIKHAIAPNRGGGWLAVSVERSNGTVNLAVRDSGPGFDPLQSPAGHGIDNLRSRLAALYGSVASITTSREDGAASVRLSIPVMMS
jgi:two-component system, LytTR family, sensor histidine kinase AlgZ